MDRKNNRDFILKTESLVKPQDVTAISFLGDFNRLLPKKTQHRIMQKGSRKIPYMGFIVDPYCLFLSYKIRNTEEAEAMLPDGYTLAEISVFKNEKKYPAVIISAFSARTSAFIGMRLEFYIIARHKETGMISWIIADYETNTNSHDPKTGFCGYTSDPAVFTASPYGELIVDFKNSLKSREFSVTADMKNGRPEELTEDLWVEGNMSVDYGGTLTDETSKPFSLIFDSVLMKEALNIPLKDVEIRHNSYLENIIDHKDPASAVIFPYSQHFIIRQDMESHTLRREEDLDHQISAFLEKDSFKTMSGDDIKRPLFRGMVISSIINIGIILFLLLKLLL